jgi:hypothetical protein
MASIGIAYWVARLHRDDVASVDTTLPRDPTDPRACSREKRDEVLAPPVTFTLPPKQNRYAKINCDLTLDPTDVVRKTLVFSGHESDGVTLDCNLATIQGTRWDDKEAIVVETEGNYGVENVTVKNCNVDGRIRVGGYGGETHWEADHTERIQRRSPRNITFDRLTITADGKDPFYVFSGALRVTLKNSRIRGKSDGVAIYLDAESAGHVIQNNGIGVHTDKREQIAIDGSARNLIVGNYFSQLDDGGIFIYRNCGEKGAIRHQFPADNVILDNIFYYDRYSGFASAVAIASRQDKSGIGYCGDDDLPGAPEIGSNLDDEDHAYRTVVAQNRFIGRKPSLTNGDFDAEPGLLFVNDDPSYVFDNVQENGAENRDSACYVPTGYPEPFLAHGKSIAMFDGGSGPRCTGQRLTCNDGTLTSAPAICASALPSQVTVVPFGCSAESNDTGCNGQIACPSGMTAGAIKAACNLEYGSVTDEELSKTPWSFAGVVRRSDEILEGVCRVGNVDVSEYGARLGVSPNARIAFSCREKDDNRGDCNIRGALACLARPTIGIQ